MCIASVEIHTDGRKIHPLSSRAYPQTSAPCVRGHPHKLHAKLFNTSLPLPRLCQNSHEIPAKTIHKLIQLQRHCKLFPMFYSQLLYRIRTRLDRIYFNYNLFEVKFVVVFLLLNHVIQKRTFITTLFTEKRPEYFVRF